MCQNWAGFSPDSAKGSTTMLVRSGRRSAASEWFWPSSASRFNIKILSYQYRKPHCGDKMVVRSSYLHNEISYTGKMSSLYWIWALAIYSMLNHYLIHSWHINGSVQDSSISSALEILTFCTKASISSFIKPLAKCWLLLEHKVKYLHTVKLF